MSDIQKYLELLELPPGADWEAVSRAYRELIKIWHPDRFANDEKLRERAEQKSKQLNEAVRQLRKHYRRTQYHRRSEISQAIAAARKTPADGNGWNAPKRSKVFQAKLDQKYRPRTTSSAVYQALARRQRRASRMIYLAAFSIFFVSLVLFGTLGLPSKPSFLQDAYPPGNAAASHELADYRIVSLSPQLPPAPESPRPWAPEARPLIIEAAANCKIGIIEDLIEKGDNINAIDANGDTALAWAARTNCAVAAKLLLQAGANPRTTANNGFTPRDWALWAKNTPVLKLLEHY